MHRVVIGAVASAMSFSALAENGFYAGANWGYFQYQEEVNLYDVSDFETDATGIGLQLGYKFNNLLIWEVRAGTQAGESRETLTILGHDHELEMTLEGYFSVYYRPEFQYRYGFVYGLVGHTHLTGEATIQELDISVDVEGNGISYGAGIGVETEKGARFSIEYLNLYETSSVTIEGINLVVAGSF